MRRTFEIPDIVAENLQEASLARNEAVLGDTQIPSISTEFTSLLGPKPESTKKLRGDDSRSEDVEDHYLLMTPGLGEKLGEDELTLIFSNTWLFAQDLLNCRLVSKRWRDAATTTLRRRDACVVELCAENDFNPPCVYKDNATLRDEDKLSQLTELISLSPKFPATDFRIYISLMGFNPYKRFQNLLNFFKLHGDKIKTLRYDGRITARYLLDILQIHAPALESLDLSEAMILESYEKYGSEGNALKWTSKAVLLKSFTFGLFEYSHSDENELIRLLLSSLTKFGSIENVTINTLQIVLTEGKGHLIRSFKYVFWDAHSVPALQLPKMISLNPKPQLSKVTLHLEDRWPSADATIVNSLNEFIESFKDTVQTLGLFCYYFQRALDPLLNIPPMKNLKSFTLKLKTWCGEDHNTYHCRVCQAEEFKIFIGIRGTFFKFQDGISPQNYFPSLMKVHLHSNLSKFNEVSPMSFFSFKSVTNNADGSAAQSAFFPKVDVLKINRMDIASRPRLEGTCHSSTETSLVADVFPNIRILKFQCGEVSNLSSGLWTLCPNVEFMEIYGIASCSSGERDVEMSHFVDKVFTGLSDQMLENLRRSAPGFSCKAENSEELKSAPKTPSISNLRNLRELKLVLVENWSTEFASSVTGVHAFSKMEHTKFIISYDPYEIPYGFDRDEDDDDRNKNDENITAANGSVENGDDKIAEYEKLIFGAIKPYVHIVHETRTFDLWDDLI